MKERLKEKLACPVCKDPLKSYIGGYGCVSCDTTYMYDSAVYENQTIDMLPIRNNRWQLCPDIDFDREPLPQELPLGELIGAANTKDIRLADITIQLIAECLFLDGRTQPDRVKLVPEIVGVLDRLYKEYSVGLEEEQKTAFLSFVTLARYELETAAGSYIGGFVLPDEILANLPKGDYLEIAMGPGDNLRKIAEAKKPYSVTGCDLSKGMVNRAKDIDYYGGSLFFRADAQYLPLLDEQYDVVMMFNCLDRVPNTKKALMESSRVLREGGTLVVGNCIPLQNEKEVEGGIKLTYVPAENRVGSMEEAIELSGCSMQDIKRDIEWRIKTIEDGNELLFVDAAIGKKQ